MSADHVLCIAINKTPQEVALPAATTANEAPSITQFNTALTTVISNFKTVYPAAGTLLLSPSCPAFLLAS